MYEINVAKRIAPSTYPGAPEAEARYEHLFSTDGDRSGDSWMLAQVLPKLREAFPAPAFSVTVTNVWKCSEPVHPGRVEQILEDHS